MEEEMQADNVKEQENNETGETTGEESQTEEETVILNKILKGETMAVDIYDQYSEQLEDQNMNNLLQQFKQDHQNHAEMISERIKNLGAEPQTNTGMTGLISKTMMEIGDLLGGRSSDQDILKKVYEGEDMGINQVEENLQTKLSSENQELITNILETDKQHLEQLKGFFPEDSEPEE